MKSKPTESLQAKKKVSIKKKVDTEGSSKILKRTGPQSRLGAGSTAKPMVAPEDEEKSKKEKSKKEKSKKEKSK